VDKVEGGDKIPITNLRSSTYRKAESFEEKQSSYWNCIVRAHSEKSQKSDRDVRCNMILRKKD